jgi:hypothetical protein
MGRIWFRHRFPAKRKKGIIDRVWDGSSGGIISQIKKKRDDRVDRLPTGIVIFEVVL